jgi:hypothetical protein
MAGCWVPDELPRDQARQIESLASCWRRNQTKAASFIESAKGAILTWQSLPAPSEPATETRDRASELKRSASNLNQVLSGAGPDFLSDIQAQVRGNLATGIAPARFSTLEAWQHLSAHYNGLNRLEPPVMLRIPEILDPLQDILSLISEAADGLEADITPKPGRNIDHELWLIDRLIQAHYKAFGRMPGKSADSPFLRFWEGLKPTLGTEASYEAVINQIRELEKAFHE